MIAQDHRTFGRVQVRHRAQRIPDQRPRAWHGAICRTPGRTTAFGGDEERRSRAAPRPESALVAEARGGSIAVFPPPHSFFWSREISINLGYSWYRKDSETSFAFGIRQPGTGAREREPGRTSLCTARVPAPTADADVSLRELHGRTGDAASRARVYAAGSLQAAAGLSGDGHALSHRACVGRLAALGGLDAKLPDFDVVKARRHQHLRPMDGMDVFRATVSRRSPNYFEVARRHSDKNFLIMPNEESSAGDLGGHNDVLLSKPVFWDYQRPAGKPFVETHPTYGKVYHVGSPADMMELAKLREHARLHAASAIEGLDRLSRMP